MQRVAVTLRTDTGKESAAEGALRRFEKGERLGRGLGALVGAFLAAGVCLFVPVLHLITTWLLPLGGIVFFASAMRTKATLTDVRGACPQCGASIKLGGGRYEDPQWDSCPECSHPLRLIPAIEPEEESG